jgi:hypothetical protein
MKYFFLITGLFISGVFVSAEEMVPPNTAGREALTKQPKPPLFTWDLLWTGSWEESKNLHNRGNLRLGLAFSEGRTRPELLLRGQVIDRRTLNFELESPWGDTSKALTSLSAGLYHPATGSRLLYGILDEWGLPARIRSPWIRSAPYTENHKPLMADLRTTVSSTKTDEAYLYLSSPRLTFFRESSFPETTLRGFASGQFTPANAAAKNYVPAYSGGLETVFGKKVGLFLEGFYTSARLPPRTSSSWFSDRPPLPERDFRLNAAALLLTTPYVSFGSDWAWSETFAWGRGIYGNAGLRVTPPLPWNAGKPGPWSLSLAADGMSERYVGRDGSSPGGGLRTAGKIEWKGPKSSLFRVNTGLRAPALDEPFERSSSGIYYRFPAASAASASGFPLRVTRISLNVDRNASDRKKIHDGIDGALGLSLNLPPMSLPLALLPNGSKGDTSARKVKNIKPKSYPLGLNLSTSIDALGSWEDKTTADKAPAPYPFFPANLEFDSAKTSAELLWSPGIFQFRTKWGYTAYAKKDNQWDGSISAAVRFKHGRFSTKFAWPTFPEKWNCTLSWRVEK